MKYKNNNDKLRQTHEHTLMCTQRLKKVNRSHTVCWQSSSC